MLWCGLTIVFLVARPPPLLPALLGLGLGLLGASGGHLARAIHTPVELWVSLHERLGLLVPVLQPVSPAPETSRATASCIPLVWHLRYLVSCL